MHGLGNDFVIIDLRINTLDLSDDFVRAICNRKTGIGCDQLILLNSPFSSEATVFMGIRNADGSESGACGNATRCVAFMLMEELGQQIVTVETKAGLLKCERRGKSDVRVKLNPPVFEWEAIPLSKDCDSMCLPFELSEYNHLKTPVALSVGNPHVVFFLDDLDRAKVHEIGPFFECHHLFPERVNVNFASIACRDKIKLKVWERGAGATLACGTGACATAVAGMKRGFVNAKVEVVQEGGSLLIEWAGGTEPIYMTGGVARVYTGMYNA